MSDENGKPRASRVLVPTIHEATVIADVAVEPVARQTKFQWAVIVLVTGAIGGLLAWNLDALKEAAIGTANAQAQAKAADNRSEANERKIDGLDAGMRMVVERLERKIDANNERQDKKLDDLQSTMRVLVQEVRKR